MKVRAAPACAIRRPMLAQVSSQELEKLPFAGATAVFRQVAYQRYQFAQPGDAKNRCGEVELANFDQASPPLRPTSTSQRAGARAILLRYPPIVANGDIASCCQSGENAPILVRGERRKRRQAPTVQSGNRAAAIGGGRFAYTRAARRTVPQLHLRHLEKSKISP